MAMESSFASRSKDMVSEHLGNGTPKWGCSFSYFTWNPYNFPGFAIMFSSWIYVCLLFFVRLLFRKVHQWSYFKGENDDPPWNPSLGKPIGYSAVGLETKWDRGWAYGIRRWLEMIQNGEHLKIPLVYCGRFPSSKSRKKTVKLVIFPYIPYVETNTGWLLVLFVAFHAHMAHMRSGTDNSIYRGQFLQDPNCSTLATLGSWNIMKDLRDTLGRYSLINLIKLN